MWLLLRAKEGQVLVAELAAVQWSQGRWARLSRLPWLPRQLTRKVLREAPLRKRGQAGV